jgi:hypothetical protein
MSNVMDQRSQDQSATEQVKERVQDVAEQTKSQTREQLRAQISSRSSQAGEQVSAAAGALRHTSEHLRREGSDSVAKVVDGAAARGERLGTYLTRADGDQILRDVEDIARKQPWLFVGGSAVLGFLASRFMKASSSGRYHGQAPVSPYPHAGGDGSAGYISPAAPALPPAGGEMRGGGSDDLD